MKIVNKINPVAKLLGDKQYSKQVIPNKKKSKLDKLSEKIKYFFGEITVTMEKKHRFLGMNISIVNRRLKLT